MRNYQEHQAPKGDTGITSLSLATDMSAQEKTNLIKDLKMMTRTKAISVAFSESLIHYLNQE